VAGDNIARFPLAEPLERSFQNLQTARLRTGTRTASMFSLTSRNLLSFWFPETDLSGRPQTDKIASGSHGWLAVQYPQNVRREALGRSEEPCEAARRLTTDLSQKFDRACTLIDPSISFQSAIRQKASPCLTTLAALDALNRLRVEPYQVDHPTSPPASPVPQQGNPLLSCGVTSGTTPQTAPLGVPPPSAVGSSPPERLEPMARAV